MIVNRNAQDNETEKTGQSFEHNKLSFDKVKNDESKIKKTKNILDKEIGSLRSIFIRVKMIFKDIYCYVKSFFTKKKIDEVRAIFSFKRVLKDNNQSTNSVISKPESEINKTTH
jgi:hypothetical protein